MCKTKTSTLALAVFGVLLSSGALAAPAFLVDDTATGATVGDPVTLGEYTGFSGGVGAGFSAMIGAGVNMYMASDTAGNLQFAIDRTAGGSGLGTNAIVIYIDSKNGGFTGTSQFFDNGPSGSPNYGRAAASALAGDPSGNDDNARCDLTFPSGFAADYAIVIEAGFAGLYTLAAGTDLGTPVSLTSYPTGDAMRREWGGFTMANLGALAGGSFKYFATLLDPKSCFRSNEFQGIDVAPAANIGTASFSMATTVGANRFNVFQSYTTCARVTPSGHFQHFNTLASTGAGNAASTVPTGWFFSEAGGDTTYATTTGTATAGDTYSFGTDQFDRAFGGLLSGSVIPTIGACLISTIETPLTGVSISYYGEQWRYGATGRQDKLDFQFSLNATSLTTGTWTDFDVLDYTAPSQAAVGAVNGNTVRQQLTGTVTAALTNGAKVWIRWNDANVSGADDGLGVDDFIAQPVLQTPTYDFGDSGSTYDTPTPGRNIIGDAFLGAIPPTAEAAAGSLGADDAQDDGIGFATASPGASIPLTRIGFVPPGYLGCLDGWLDSNSDGVFHPTNEQLWNDLGVTSTTQTMNITAPATPGAYKMRWRMSMTVTGFPCPVVNPTGDVVNGETEDYILNVVGANYDYGDAGTTYDNPTPARHEIGTGYLGTIAPDADTVAGAVGDDNAQDDGVVLGSLHRGSNSATIRATIPGGQVACVSAWVDFNNNGSFDAVTERIFDNQVVTATATAYNFTIPNTATLASTQARFRVGFGATQGACPAMNPTGDVTNGEVEDYPVTLVAFCPNNFVEGTEQCDDGDAGGDGCNLGCTFDLGWTCTGTSSICTCDATNGYSSDGSGNCFQYDFGDSGIETLARAQAGTLRLGTFWTPETAASTTNADVDDDGVTTTPLTFRAGLQKTIGINVGGTAGTPGVVDAWIDWNRNSVFEASERVSALAVTAGQAASLNVTAPNNASIGQAFMRVRVSNTTVAGVASLSNNGEIEDYLVDIISSCGDGIINGDDICDDGDNNNTAGCRNNCSGANTGYDCSAGGPCLCDGPVVCGANPDGNACTAPVCTSLGVCSEPAVSDIPTLDTTYGTAGTVDASAATAPLDIELASNPYGPVTFVLDNDGRVRSYPGAYNAVAAGPAGVAFTRDANARLYLPTATNKVEVTAQYRWVSAGTGDCVGADLNETTGNGFPDDARCDAAHAGQTAVCWDNVSFSHPQGPKCTYKSTPIASCTGGPTTGQRFVCTAPQIGASATLGTTEAGFNLGMFNGPREVVLSPDGSKAYVLDTGNDRIQIVDTSIPRVADECTAHELDNAIDVTADSRGCLIVADASTTQSGVSGYVRRLGCTCPDPGEFTLAQTPLAIAVDSAGQVYVAASDAVRKYARGGALLATINTTNAVTALEVFQDKLYALSTSGKTVRRYNLNRVACDDENACTGTGTTTDVCQIGACGAGMPKVCPTSACSTTGCDIDTGVCSSTPLGADFATQATITTGGATAYSNVQGVGVSSDGNVYVGDANFVHVYGSDGTYRSSVNIGGGIAGDVDVDQQGNIYVADFVAQSVKVFNRCDTNCGSTTLRATLGSGQMGSIRDLDVDKDGTAWVSDGTHHVIWKCLGSSPTCTVGFGTLDVSGSGNTALNNALGVAVNDAGFMYIADSGNNRVIVAKTDGTYVSQKTFANPWNVALDENGVVSVLYTTGTRVDRFPGDINATALDGVTVETGATDIATLGGRLFVVHNTNTLRIRRAPTTACEGASACVSAGVCGSGACVPVTRVSGTAFENQPVCGDGRACTTGPFTEQCDDNNGRSGDGCSSTCTTEANSGCSGLGGAITLCDTACAADCSATSSTTSSDFNGGLPSGWSVIASGGGTGALAGRFTLTNRGLIGTTSGFDPAGNVGVQVTAQFTLGQNGVLLNIDEANVMTRAVLNGTFTGQLPSDHVRCYVSGNQRLNLASVAASTVVLAARGVPFTVAVGQRVQLTMTDNGRFVTCTAKNIVTGQSATITGYDNATRAGTSNRLVLASGVGATTRTEIEWVDVRRASDEQCQSRLCQANGSCAAANDPNGQTCSDFTSFTIGEQCATGICNICGDGVIGGTEACDDGNSTNTDGCLNTCTIDPNFTCSGTPSVCIPKIDVSVALSHVPDTLYANAAGVARVVLTNNTSAAPATGVRFVIAKVAGVTYTPPASGANCSATNGAQVDCTLSTNLVNGTPQTFDVGVTFTNPTAVASAAHTVNVTIATNTDPNTANNSASATLNHQWCGDNTTNGGEQCDNGPSNGNGANQCRTTCLNPFCGDGVLDPGAPLNETCDDGVPSGTLPNAGCSAACVADEVNFSCNGASPTVCTARIDLTFGVFAFQKASVYANGESTTLNISVKNNGPGGATNVKAKFTVPTNVTLGALPAGCVLVDSNANIECTFNTVNDGATSGVFQIPVTAPNLLEQPSTTSNLLQITQTAPEKNAANNTSSTTMVVHFCGDNSIEGTAGEECDDGNANNLDQPNKCRVLCKLPKCGDNIIDNSATYGSETCDDGNASNADSCPTGTLVAGHPLCKTATCGDGYLFNTGGGTETCDDGDGVKTDDCPDGPDPDGAGPILAGTCKANVCGDGHQDLEGGTQEGCDDGNLSNNDACPSGTATSGHPVCTPASCGDSYLFNTGAGTETCDDGNLNQNDDCPDGATGSCKTATCGDGYVNITVAGELPKEDCDQRGNSASDDGCNATCKAEPGYLCVNTGGATPSQTCTATCGVFYNFQTDNSAHNVSPDPSAIFVFGTSSKFTASAPGWYTGLSANLPSSAVTAVIAKTVSVQSLDRGRAPKVEVDVQTDMLAGDCVELHVAATRDTTAGSLRDSFCGTGTRTLTTSLVSTPNTNVVATIVVKSTASATARKGVWVKAMRFLSDVDGDNINEVRGLTCSDACVDGDHDLYADPITSGNRTLCTGGISATKDDCNDLVAAIRPDIDETACTDGIDNNCDTFKDGADQYCFEICGDNIENGKKLDGQPATNGIDCADAGCKAYSYTLSPAPTVNVPADPYCATPCLLEWSFDRGGVWTEDASADDIFEPLGGSDPGWTTGPTNDATRKVARLQYTFPSFGNATQRGPKPTLVVDFTMAANPVGKDVFAVCIENKTCQATTPNITKLTELSTGGRVSRTVDLTPWLGNAGPDGNLDITLLFDTFEVTNGQPANVQLDIFNIRLQSDIDTDALTAGVAGGYEGTVIAGLTGTCDQCWDADHDGYGLQTSPNITTCCFSSGTCTGVPAGCTQGSTNPECFDCNDDPTPGKGANAHPPRSTIEAICGDGLDNNCDGETDGADGDCGSEDCANKVDDNGDNAIDCLDQSCSTDPACSPCELSFEFERGRINNEDSAGFVASVGGIFEWGVVANQFGGAGGWWTVKEGILAQVVAQGPVKATLTRTDVLVSTAYERPTVELVYDLKGATTLVGLCIDKPASQCGTATPANFAWVSNVQSPSSGTPSNPVNLVYRGSDNRDHAVVPITKGTHSLVIVFESTEVNVDGLFLDAVRVRSDIDLDDKGEAQNIICDHCVDFDQDGRGVSTVGVADLTTCPVPFADDCDDFDKNAYPRPGEQIVGDDPDVDYCFTGGSDISDDDCDGLADTADSDCNTCGDGRIGQGETCDPPTPGECSDQCQLLDSSRVFLSEIHFPILFGDRAEQWIELYNPADQPVDVLLAGLKIQVCADDPNANPPAPDRTDCRQVSFVTETVNGQPVAPACQIVGSRTTIGTGTADDPRFFVITFGLPQDSAFYDTSIIDAACSDPTFTLPDGDEWLLVEAGATELDRVPFGGFDTCLFKYQEVVTGFEPRGRSIMLESLSSGANGNNNPESWCLAGRDQTYATTTGHLGSPGTIGSCAEVVCDGKDDDCDGDGSFAATLADEGEELADFDGDFDGDGICNEMDCEALVSSCTYDTNPDPNANPCTDDADGDGAPDCRDNCFDIDRDGYGDVSKNTSGCQRTNPNDPATVKTEASVCDGDNLVNPGLSESDTVTCTDDRDNDCDGQKNCLDSVCAAQSVCTGETCAKAVVVECGSVTTVTATSEDFVMCDVGHAADPQIAGKDRVFKFVAPSSAGVRFEVENLGTRRHELFVSAGGNPALDDTCAETSCTNVVGTGAALCADKATVNIATPVAGETYAVVLKAQGTCNLGTGGAARLTVVCSEECGQDGVDEDKDGKADCADTDCALDEDCANSDPDGDGVTNAVEIFCECRNYPGNPVCTAPSDPSDRPSDDDVQNLDEDQIVNCRDDDDDGDGTSDDAEIAACLDPLSKNNPLFHPGAQGECCTSGSAVENQFCRDQGIDANCNRAIDTTEAIACDTKESNCGDLVDDDFDGATDCDDFDCVRATLCGEEDRDGDCVSNRVEIICNTSPTVAGTHIAGVACADGSDACAFSGEARFQNSDGGSLFPEAASGQPACPNPLPADCDGQSCVSDDVPNCADDDDDGDLYDDVQETVCGSDNLDAQSLPPDLDGDHQCDDTDEDDDDDGFLDLVERNCALDATDRELAPRDPESTPDDLLHDIDQDGTCNALDDDIDGDDWLNTIEVECLTDPMDVDSNPSRQNADVDQDFLCNLIDTDDDGDGWADTLETPSTCLTSANDPLDVPQDTDLDKQCNPLDTDDDNDGVQDITELGCNTDPLDVADFPSEGDAQDPDHDTKPNCIDDDDDGDLVSDANERIIGSEILVVDTDGDGIDDGDENANHNSVVDPTETSPTMTDTDSDFIDDLTELESSYPDPDGGAPKPTLGYDEDTDDDGVVDGMEDKNHDGNLDAGETNPLDDDSDDDGFIDGEEVKCATDPLKAQSVPVDRDNDGVCDGYQVELEDCDSDGVADGVEIFCGFAECDASETPSFADLVDTNNDGEINCVDNDDDADGFNDVEELTCGTDPRIAASIPTDDDRRDYDGDTLLNCIDPDDDDDGLTDVKEAQNNTNSQDQDSDDDGLSDKVETDIFTNPNNPDTDGDGVQDGTETAATVGTKDTDPDVFIPDADPSTQTNPLVADHDGDGVTDGDEDSNKNGRVDPGEGDPLNQLDGLNDTDHDGLIDRVERPKSDGGLGTDPENPDTDGDGLDDGREVNVEHTDPLDSDSDDGGVQDGFEIDNKTDPLVKDDDYRDATLQGDTIFGCGTADGGLVGLGLGLAALMMMLRRRARGGVQ